ncbi:MAG: exonuclease SbcCD subunit D C-terminal domain-containing protein [Saprospiraceae bacterium]|nr:exonuclease SbcCD subunit D C-terminal domain-containing protein [Saprospiraceae bacterium]MCB0623807.1 exonuclease SbcCD subunit D C-terminal domain-containing protein [Saprospiraceae bacterium]MCB0683988.1 exonuclease SbcCD subunit D C-terminal domain-containing protein [Saprospiraceae bacterium]
MRLLHTSDWHLGQKFLYFDREQEHEAALQWLLRTIDEESVELLIVAGDIFDIGNPPNYARRQYYRFLAGLIGSSCRHIVLIGGNHDSPSMLDAPKELLAALNVQVVGSAPEDLAREVIELRSPQGDLEAVVAAVPFLRDRDLRPAQIGESGLERIDRIREGIRQHYERVGERVEPYRKDQVPLIATGHLYATGAEASGKQDDIYIGNVENIAADQFPAVFDYVALGHIHRAQAVGGLDHIRYCGSLIPLSFSETKDDKSVTLVDFKGSRLGEVRHLPVPLFRRLKTIEGELPEVQDRLAKLGADYSEGLPPWVEVIVHSDAILPNLDEELHEFTAEMNLQLLKIKTNQAFLALDEQMEAVDLQELTPEEVFVKRCETAGRPPEQLEELVATFRELQSWMNEREE